MEKSKQDLLDEIERLKKINESLVTNVLLRQENSSSFKLFQQNATLESEVQRRTEELELLTKYFKNEHNILDSILRTLPGIIWLIDTGRNTRKCFNLNSMGLKDEKELQELKTPYGSLYDVIQSKIHNQNQEQTASTSELEIIENKSITRLEVTISSNDSQIPVIFIQDRSQIYAQEETIRQQELQIQQSSKLASLGEMASSVAHEINNPLAIINASVTLSNKLLKKNKIDIEELKSINSAVKGGVDRIALIIKAMRNLSREGSSFLKEPVLVRDLFEQVTSLSKDRFKESNIEFSLKISEELEKQTFLCNQVQISQVLISLLNNSFDAINSNKEKWINIEVNRDAQMDHISIVDSGNGIQTEILDKVFQPFFTSKELGKGTGLSLSIAKTIIEKHGGSLQVDPTSANTKFVISIPRY